MKKTLLLAALAAVALDVAAVQVTSPDGNVVADFDVVGRSTQYSCLLYTNTTPRD